MNRTLVFSMLVLTGLAIVFVSYYSGTEFFSVYSSSDKFEDVENFSSDINHKIKIDYSVGETRSQEEKNTEEQDNTDESNIEVYNNEATSGYSMPSEQQSIGLPPAPIITEVEANPAGDDSGHEWIEMFYAEDIDFVNDYYFETYSGKKFNLTGSYTGFFAITLPTQWINNANEKIYLKYKDGSIMSETPLMNDSANNDKTWNRCISKWIMNYATPDYWNNCTLTCLGDLDYNSQIDGADLGTVLGYWGWLDNGYSDITGDARMNESDTDYLLEHWGVCS